VNKMSHPLENNDQLEGNALDVGGYVGVDPRFQTDLDVLKQDNPFQGEVRESNLEVTKVEKKSDADEKKADDDDKDEDDKPEPKKAPAKSAPKAPAVPAPGEK